MANSGDLGVYLSWAPYWWPDCNWCPANSSSSSTAMDSSKRKRLFRKRMDDPTFTDATAPANPSFTTTTTVDRMTSTSTGFESSVTAATTTTEDGDGLVFHPMNKQNGYKKMSKSLSVVSTTTTATTSTATGPAITNYRDYLNSNGSRYYDHHLNR